MLPWVWAQTSTLDPVAAPALAIRRWYASLTLSSPEPAPSLFGLWLWLGGLSALLVVAIAFQGPRRALGQLLGIPGHFRLLRAALARFKHAGRPVAILFGTTVLAWSVSQFLSFNKAERREDLIILMKSKTVGEVAAEQGSLAAPVPLRDLFGLGDSLILLVAATAVVFKLSADRWGSLDDAADTPHAPLPAWTTLCWGSTWLYAMYRFASLVVDRGGFPLGGCLFIEAAVVPALMLISDGLLLAWLLVELRAAGLGVVSEGIDARGAIHLLPGAILACLLTLPGRYLATGDLLLLPYIPTGVAKRWLVPLVHGWGLAELQAAALMMAGIAGAVAWSSGSMREAVGGYVRLLRAEGGHLVATLAAAGAAAGGITALAYLLVLSLPPQAWVLAAADSYAHYGTLPIGLITLSALVELGGRSLPEAVVPDESGISVAGMSELG